MVCGIYLRANTICIRLKFVIFLSHFSFPVSFEFILFVFASSKMLEKKNGLENFASHNRIVLFTWSIVNWNIWYDRLIHSETKQISMSFQHTLRRRRCSRMTIVLENGYYTSFLSASFDSSSSLMTQYELYYFFSLVFAHLQSEMYLFLISNTFQFSLKLRKTQNFVRLPDRIAHS